MSKEFVMDYCPQCERETPHIRMHNDEVFGEAIQCEVCETIFEATKEESE